MGSVLSRQRVCGASLFILLILLLAACSGPVGQNASPASASAKVSASMTPSPSSMPPAIKLGVQPCPSVVNSPTYWAPIIPTQPDINAVDKVMCANLLGSASLQAVVAVRNRGNAAGLDIYVYGNITQPRPPVLFKLQGLLRGDVKVSNYNTLLTAEIDPDSSLNAGKVVSSQQVDLFREFKWSDSAATLIPVTFPGLFPVLTRYQAEDEQQKVNQGQNFWERDAAQTASHFAAQLLNWSGAPTNIVSGGTGHDADAQVVVKNPGNSNSTIKLTISRLEGNTNGGIWIVTTAGSDGLTLTAPNSLDRLISPVTVTGQGNAFEGIVGNVKILNHLYDPIGNAQVRGTNGNGNTAFTATVSYTKTFKNGTEEGLVLLVANSQADGSISAAVIVKDLLS